MTLTCCYLDDSPADPCLPYDSGRTVDYSHVLALGVEHWYIPLSSVGKYEEVDGIMEERGYRYRDFVTLNKEALGEALEPKERVISCQFTRRHMYEFEEARYVLTGHVYWDTHGKSLIHIPEFFFLLEHPTGVWVRFKVGLGDLANILRWHVSPLQARQQD
ncbi:hypothetical protein EDD16DRAFT_1484084 [Pisolithus croceorrhizus]|nr:hypothetical protein EDD16DRAFT_1484084 [Pisolithus croceorrhizus]KAI6134250.1 hypothetical protein EV401DRAFT_2251530 [Pisolithus croceorrhizus]KAI6143557.1 hypothetical protein EDD17DRAFT_1497288 [Pisolithus thermaeus]